MLAPVLLAVVCGLGTVLSGPDCVPLTCASGSVWQDGACAPCPPGTWADAVAGACAPCPLQHVNPGYGAVACVACPPDRVANALGTACEDFDAADIERCAWPGLPDGCTLASEEHNATWTCVGTACRTRGECLAQWAHEGCDVECKTPHDLLPSSEWRIHPWLLVVWAGFVALWTLVSLVLVCALTPSDYVSRTLKVQ